MTEDERLLYEAVLRGLEAGLTADQIRRLSRRESAVS
jgi:hypothetical protein